VPVLRMNRRPPSCRQFLSVPPVRFPTRTHCVRIVVEALISLSPFPPYGAGRHGDSGGRRHGRAYVRCARDAARPPHDARQEVVALAALPLRSMAVPSLPRALLRLDVRRPRRRERSAREAPAPPRRLGEVPHRPARGQLPPRMPPLSCRSCRRAHVHPTAAAGARVTSGGRAQKKETGRRHSGPQV